MVGSGSMRRSGELIFPNLYLIVMIFLDDFKLSLTRSRRMARPRMTRWDRASCLRVLCGHQAVLFLLPDSPNARAKGRDGTSADRRNAPAAAPYICAGLP